MGWEVVIRTLDRFPPERVFSLPAAPGLCWSTACAPLCLPFSSQSAASAARLTFRYILCFPLCSEDGFIYFFPEAFFQKTSVVPIPHNQTLLPEIQGHSQRSPLCTNLTYQAGPGI